MIKCIAAQEKQKYEKNVYEWAAKLCFFYNRVLVTFAFEDWSASLTCFRQNRK